MDLMALSIFLLAFVVCSILVFFISVYGTKEVTFEENLKASQISSSSASKKKVQESKKKAKKVTKSEIESKTDLEEKPATPSPTPEPEDLPEIEPIVEEAPKVNLLPQDDFKQDSSAEPTPKKTKKDKKNKIKIEEIEISEPSTTPDIELIQTIPVQGPNEIDGQILEVEKKNVKNKKKKVKDDISEKHGDSTVDLIPLIMKTPMDDMEIQNVIDLLLTKQIGTSAPVNHDWVEASEKNETKQLQRQLAEKETLLADEVAKSKSLTDRMNVLRQELNQLKTAHVQTQRYVSDQESQRKHLEARLHGEMENHQRYVQTLQNQIQYHSTRANGLQHSLDSLSAQQVNQQMDPAIYNELETLRSIKMSLEAEKHNFEINLNSLHGQLSQQQDEIQQVQQKLNKKSNDLEDTKNSLKSALDKNQQLSERLSGMEKNNHLENEFEEIKRINQDLEDKVKELSTKCMRQKNELSKLSDDNTRLTEDNERISDQLANYVERPQTEGREANGTSTPEPNGKAHEEENVWHKKYLAMSQEHEQIIKEKDVILQKLHSAESQFKSQVSKLESDLDVQRGKNNDKNQQEVQLVKTESEQNQKLFLQRLFPDIKAPKANQSHQDWLEVFADEVNKCKNVNKQQPKPSVDNEQLQKLEGQVKHYKSVLAETENMLNQLQASVESEESNWKSKLFSKESEVEQLQRKLEASESKNAALEASMNSLNSVEEVNC